MSQFSFPKPKSVLINCYNKNFDEETLEPFISSNLVSIEICTGLWSKRFFDKLLECESLRKFYLSSKYIDDNEPGVGFLPSELIDWLEKMPQLTHLGFHESQYLAIGYDLFPVLFRRRNLEVLDMDRIYLGRASINIFDDFYDLNTLPALKFLSICADDDVLKYLVPKLPVLTGIRLTSFQNDLLGPETEDSLIDLMDGRIVASVPPPLGSPGAWVGFLLVQSLRKLH